MQPRLTGLAIAALLSALTWCTAELALMFRAWRGVPDLAVMVVSDQLTATQSIVDARLASLEQRTDAQATALRRDVLARVDVLIERTDARVTEALALSNRQLADALTIVDTRTGEMIGQTRATTEAAAGTLQSVQRIAAAWEPWMDCGGPGEGEGKVCLQSKMWWMTQKADSMMTSLAIATPKLVHAAELSAMSGQAAAASAAQTSANLAAITRPGPRWLRYAGMGLSVAAPGAQVAVPFVIGRLP